MSEHPRATYRLQLNPEFGFYQAAEVCGYLERLGVSHVYTSPYLQARSGSDHGYDVVAHDRVNEELGGPLGHEVMLRAVAASRLEHLIDVVPNHMAVTGGDNRWWWDVLKHGRSSRYARYFDIDWNPPDEKLKETILAPVLADHYGRLLEKGEITLGKGADEYLIQYSSLTFPVATGTLDDFEVDGEIDLETINSDPDALHTILDRQNYRLSFWRTAAKELDYRRFFDINELAGLKVEDQQVFEDTHQLILQWFQEGKVSGFRIDHPDGLKDPKKYLDTLASSAPGAWILVEKILGWEEDLPADWPVHGTTGYDFLGTVLRLFIEPGSEGLFSDLYREFTGSTLDFDEVSYSSKKDILGSTLETDVRRLTQLFAQICERNRRYRDYTKSEIFDVLQESLANFPVYRTYVSATRPPTEPERSFIDQAFTQLSERRSDIDPDLLGFLRSLLLGMGSDDLESEFVLRFQQVSAPVMAKGVEDTAFYRYNRFIALNEVGSEPSVFHCPIGRFHELNAKAQSAYPRRMLATSTHDTKRSEDVRARLAVLTEIPDGWRGAVLRWSRMNRSKRPAVPDPHLEYLFYQSLVGAHPVSLDRMKAFMLKASREAKTATSWVEPDDRFEQGIMSFVEECLSDSEFTSDVAEFVDAIRDFGWINSLSQTALKLMAPGVPDIYQGCELWDLSLVDPDNRRPVDFHLRSALLDRVASMSAREAWTGLAEGIPKLFLIQRALMLRKQVPEVFGESSAYEPFRVVGEKADHVVGFTRGGRVAVLVPRLVSRLQGDWGDTRIDLGPEVWEEILTGQRVQGDVALATLLKEFPVGLLRRSK